ncbi:SIMPL domain-containing protein [Candidatus Woesebacteria bacterium]|nr:SIMPL domain-containing protein [Candidatus Woesebacteria bacterium]
MKGLYFVLIPVITLVTLLIVQLSGLSLPMHITMTTGSSADFSVVGEGKIEVVPDTGYVDIGITINKAVSAEEAQNQVAKINNQLVEKMKEFGIGAEDIKTTNYSVNPNYDYSNNSSGTIQGYNASAQLSIKVQKASSLGEVAQAATAAGATDIYNTRFNIESPEKYREQARTKAIENAREQARKLASQLGIKLGRVTNVVESSDANPIYPMYELKSVMGGGGGSADLQPGQQTITSTVTLYFEKK